MTRKWNTLMRGLGVVCAVALVAGLMGCGGDEAAPPAESGTVSEMPPMMPEQPRPEMTPIPVGEEHFLDALAELENQLVVEWVEHVDNEVYVGVVRAAYLNDTSPVVAGALRAHKTKGAPITAYIVDARVAEKGWRPGDEGLVDTLKMPLELNLGGDRDADEPTDQ